jgi:hypothetical protein
MFKAIDYGPLISANPNKSIGKWYKVFVICIFGRGRRFDLTIQQQGLTSWELGALSCEL